MENIVQILDYNNNLIEAENDIVSYIEKAFLAGKLVYIPIAETYLLEPDRPDEPTGPVIEVGPGRQFEELHMIPEPADNTTIKIYYRSAPYLGKLALTRRNLTVQGIGGPNGEKPIIDGRGAIEPDWSKRLYWTPDVSRQGILSVVTAPGKPKTANVVIDGLKLLGARQANGFWNYAAAAIALYRCEDVTVKNCDISDCDNGIFGKSYGNPAEDIVRILISGNIFGGCGVSGSYHYHNTYIEGIDVIYEFNIYNKPISGTQGTNLKDRGCRTIIRYNQFEGAPRILDLVDPEDGAPSFLSEVNFGKMWVYGNVIFNPQSNGSATMIHFGYDGKAENAQKTLYFYNNTVLDKNTLVPGVSGRWYTYPFKTNGGQVLNVANNIFFSYSPDKTKSPGEFRFCVEEYGISTKIILVQNWLPSWSQIGSVAPSNVTGWSQQLFGTNPGFVDHPNWDVSLRSDSVCLNKVEPTVFFGWSLEQPEFSWKPDGTFVDRFSVDHLGAVEY